MNASPGNNISAIILAAGFSSRMNDFKPLLPCNEKTMIETVIDLFKVNNIHNILVITGHNNRQLEPLVEKAGAYPIFNENFESGMFSSIKKGISNINSDSSGFFLLPVDIPALRPSTISLMIQEFQKSKNNIIMPYFNKKSGHPPLIPCKFINEILNLGSQSTLRDFFSSHKDSVIPLETFDRGILMDADDKTAYKLMCQKINLLNIPDQKECLAIIDKFLPLNIDIQAHLKKVSDTAFKLACSVTDNLNFDLILAGALLHDIKRLEKNHAKAGAQLISNMGFEKVSEIVSQHMDIKINIQGPIKEKEIVYFADKVSKGNKLNLDFHKRFNESILKFPKAKTNITKRYENTKIIQTRIEKSSGKSISEILSE